MTTVDVFPDAPKFVRTYLLTQLTLTSLVGQRIATESKGIFPELRLQRIGGIPSIRRRLDSARIQFEAYGNSQGEASSVARITRSLVHLMPGTVTAAGVCTGVDDDLGLSWLPDASRTPDIPRFVFGCIVHLRAAV